MSAHTDMQAFDILSHSVISAVFDDMPVAAAVVDSDRCIVYVNKKFRELAGITNDESILGRRVGEALGCIHSREKGLFCGETAYCRFCAVTASMLSGLNGNAGIDDYRITRLKGGRQESLDFKVWTKPFEWQKRKLIVYTLLDVSDEKRRKVLEHTFFHDVLNIASGLKAIYDLITKTGPPQNMADLVLSARRSVDQLLAEITAHRDLIDAENNELRVRCDYIRSRDLLEEIKYLYDNQPLSESRRIVLSAQNQDIALETDSILLKRVIGNMVKNALEATGAGEAVTVGCDRTEDTVTFWVHNRQAMPEQVRRQIFKRSFSTKGNGRGIGTYSIKLLGERYLEGHVAFTSDGEQGTRFQITLPLKKR